MIRKVVQDTAAAGREARRVVAMELSRCQGFSPSQHVLGKLPHFPLDYRVSDLVVCRRDNVPPKPGVVWSTVSRVIGREAGNALWLLNEGVPVYRPVLLSVHKLRPADE